MNRSLVAIMVTGLLGCGGGDRFTDAGAGDDAPDAAGGDDVDGAGGSTGLVTVLALGGYGVPQPDRPVMFHDPGGTLVARTVTDADGRASAEVAAGSSVTVIDPNGSGLITVLAIEPGDQLVVGLERNAGAPLGTATVNLPAGGATYRVSGPCASGSASSTAVSVLLTDACAATAPLLAARNPGAGLDGYIYAPAQPLAAGATVTLAGPWQPPATFPVSITGLSGVDYGLLTTWLVADGQRLLAASATPAASDGAIAASMPYPSGAGDATLVSVTVGDSGGTRFQTDVVYDGTRRSSLTLDAAALLPLPTLGPLTPGDDAGVTWQAGDGHDGTEITLTGFGPKGEKRGRWDLIAPPSARSIELLELPADLAGAWEPQYARVSVTVIDSSAIDGYGQFRAAVGFSGHVPFLLDAPLHVRTATAAR